MNRFNFISSYRRPVIHWCRSGCNVRVQKAGDYCNTVMHFYTRKYDALGIVQQRIRESINGQEMTWTEPTRNTPNQHTIIEELIVGPTRRQSVEMRERQLTEMLSTPTSLQQIANSMRPPQYENQMTPQQIDLNQLLPARTFNLSRTYVEQIRWARAFNRIENQ